jgi:hypothetical protein
VKCHTGLSDIAIALFGSFSGGRSHDRYRLDLWMESAEVKNNALETGNA